MSFLKTLGLRLRKIYSTQSFADVVNSMNQTIPAPVEITPEVSFNFCTGSDEKVVFPVMPDDHSVLWTVLLTTNSLYRRTPPSCSRPWSQSLVHDPIPQHPTAMIKGVQLGPHLVISNSFSFMK